MDSVEDGHNWFWTECSKGRISNVLAFAYILNIDTTYNQSSGACVKKHVTGYLFIKRARSYRRDNHRKGYRSNNQEKVIEEIIKRKGYRRRNRGKDYRRSNQEKVIEWITRDVLYTMNRYYRISKKIDLRYEWWKKKHEEIPVKVLQEPKEIIFQIYIKIEYGIMKWMHLQCQLRVHF